MLNKLRIVYLIAFLFSTIVAHSQKVSVGSGSYTKTFPGHDQVGRNGFPPGLPQLSGKAVGKPVPTNDWWSKLLQENHASNLFNYPFTLKTVNAGLVVSYVPSGVIDDLLPVTVGVSGLAASRATISNYGDWTVSMNWSIGSHNFEATAGVGMPFLYFTKASTDVAEVTITSGTVEQADEILIIRKAKNGADFAVYAPKGSVWVKGSGGVYTSTLNGQNYWSLAFIPLTAPNAVQTAKDYQKYAYTFPKDTKVEWAYDEKTSIVRSDFTVETDVKEGAENMLLGLLPHQWANLASNSPKPEGFSYKTIRGEMKTLAGSHFSVENTFYGILPTLPYVDEQSVGFSPAMLKSKVDALKNDELAAWTDSYNEGQVMNRLIQTARIADEMGNVTARDLMLKTIKNRLEDWLSYNSGEVAFLFYYNADWTAMLGYPAGHGQDNNLNDHHFHWGYFIHAASFVEQYEPGWASKWGDMINLLIRDAASPDRNDTLFPFLRNFSPYAGHSWANGFASFPQGNDQESTSESMQFNSSLIHWGEVTGNKAVRDLGIYLYTTEQTAIEEYWFDVHGRNFPSTQQYSLVSRLWGNNFDNGTFWTNDIAASYGIELYPIHGGSLYLGHNIEYVEKLSTEIKKNTGIMSNQANDNLWHDIMWEYFSFTDPELAIELYDSYPNRSIKFGVSDAQTYHWLHSMNALGQVDATVTADYPIAATFNKNGMLSYVAHNYGNQPITVTFSTGYKLEVPARKIAVGKAGSALPSVSITSPKSKSKFEVGERVSITASAIDYNGGMIEKVEFFQNGEFIGIATVQPFTVSWKMPKAGSYELTAKATNDKGDMGLSRAISIAVTSDSPCVETSKEASQGSFSAGYKTLFETIGTDVNVVFEMLDADKAGVVAYLWEMEPFKESMMPEIEKNKFSTTITGLSKGQTLKLSCKFAYAGGMSVTKVFTYIVGTECGVSGIDENIEENNILLYPNPVYSELTIKTDKRIKELEVRNVLGQLVMVNKTQKDDETTLQLVGLASGHFFVTIKFADGEIVTRKIIKR